MRWVKAVKAGLGGVRNGMVGRGEVRRLRYGKARRGLVGRGGQLSLTKGKYYNGKF